MLSVWMLPVPVADSSSSSVRVLNSTVLFVLDVELVFFMDEVSGCDCAARVGGVEFVECVGVVAWTPLNVAKKSWRVGPRMVQASSLPRAFPMSSSSPTMD